VIIIFRTGHRVVARCDKRDLS